LTTHDERLADRVRFLRQHGEDSKYRSAEPGYTGRLDTIQALVLLRKLPLLAQWNVQRRGAAGAYAHELHDVGDLRLPAVVPGSSPVWHLFVVRTADPERLGTYLRERGIATGRHYPELPHLSRAYADLGLRRGMFPVAEAIAREALSLPLFPGISESQIARVCAAIRDYFNRG
jgi:dTDP-4-amino-4,6-dideoxygalactose transaminase